MGCLFPFFATFAFFLTGLPSLWFPSGFRFDLAMLDSDIGFAFVFDFGSF